MRINRGLPIYVRPVVTGFVVLFGVLTIIASGTTMVWVKPGGTTDEFNKDKYACMQESQQPVSSTYVNRYAGVSTSDVQTNESLFSACMNARGWSLQAQSQPIAPATRSTEPPSPDPQQQQMIRAEKSRQWTKYAKNSNGNSFYYDATSVSLDGQYATFREWVEYSPQGGGTANLKDTWRTNTINCRDNLVRLSNFLIVDNNGRVRPLNDIEWKAMPAGSGLSLLAKKICTNSPSVQQELSTESSSPDPQQEQMIRTEKLRQWTQYAKDAKGHLFYYDVTSLSLTEGRYASVREWVEYSSEAAGTENLSRVWRTSTINCKDNLIQFAHFLILDNKGQIRKRQTDTTEWTAVPAGSAMSILSNKICTNIK